MAQVYYLAVTRKMERDIGHQRTFTSMAEKMFFMCELSAEMLLTDQMKLHFKAFPERIRQYFGSRAQDVEEDHWHHDLLSQTLLVRDDDGHYRTAHRSLLEFFVAYKLAAEIGALGDEYLTVLRSPAQGDADIAPVTYRWSTFFGGTDPGLTSLAPLAGFTRDTEERLAAGWGRAKVDGTLGGLLFLLCGEDRIKAALASSGVAPLTSAHFVARLLSILRDHDRMGAVTLEGAVVSGVRLTSVDMRGARLARTQWLEGSLSNVRLDEADLSGARFQNMRLTDVTLRHSKLACIELSEGTTMTTTVMAAAWGRASRREVVVVSSGDGRFFVVDPHRGQGIEVSPGFDEHSWHQEVEGPVDCPPFGVVDFGVRPKAVAGLGNAPAWRLPLLTTAVQMSYERSTLGIDVDEELVVIRSRAPDTELIRGRFIDASSRSPDAPEDSFMTVAPSGRMLAGIRRASGVYMAVVLRQDRSELPLAGYNGGWKASGSFSPGESLIAVGEDSGGIRFWRTDTGERVARFVVPVALTGAIVDNASGIAPATLRFVNPTPHGFAIDIPRNDSDTAEGG